MSWNLSCPDWQQRLRTGRPPFRDLALYAPDSERAVAVFNKLRLADVPGTPTLADAGGDWFRAVVRAMFGSMDPVTRARMIRELFLLVPKKNSKALALDTLIATPTGFTTMGAVQVGDLVIAADGKPTRVICKSEVFTGHRCLEVEFSTGERVVCDEQHLWVTDAHTDRERQARAARSNPCPSPKTAGEIERSLTVRMGDAKASNHRTALAGALDLPAAELPIPPYVLGAWLGDGHAEGARITAAADDAAQIVRQLRATGHPARVMTADKRSNAVTISIASEAGNSPKVYRFYTEAQRLGVLKNKHIPAAYLRGSRAQRLALLQGLMDTDGSISKAGQASFVTTLAALRDGVVELVASLGLKPTFSEHRAKLNGVDCGPFWRVQFWPFSDLPVFTMPRKLARQKQRRVDSRAARSCTRQIVAVREVDSVPTQCIGVESECHQFLVTRSLIPTHNTTNGALLMLTALLLNQRPRANFILTGPVQDSSDTAFQAASGAIALDEVLEKKLHVREHLKKIIHRETKAELEIMTFDPAVLTGQKVSGGVLIDELHVISKMSKAASAIRQLRGGMLPFPEAFLAFITTQSEEEPAGVFKDELEKARAIRDGEREGAMLPVLYEFPIEMQQDREQWENPENWPMVTPNAGRSISIARLKEEFAVAKATSEAELRAWASQHLDIQIGLALKGNGWAGAEHWEKNVDRTLTLEELLRRSEVVTVGIDGGGLDDLLGLAVLGREAETKRMLLWVRAWAHPSVLERRKEIAPRLLDFVKQGDLVLVERPSQDVDDAADIVEQCEVSGLLDRIGVDQAGIGAIVDAIVDRKIDFERIVGIQQGWRMMSAVKTTERWLYDGKLVHGDQPVAAWAVGNARPESRGNAVVITKQQAGTAKIDPLMATFNAVTLMSLNPKPRRKQFQLLFM